MNRLSVLVVGLSALAVGCGGSSPSEPAARQGTRTTSTFSVPLSPANEVPPVTNADASGTGTATIALTVTKDNSGNVTAATANFQINVTGFPAGTAPTGAHIHTGLAGANGGVYVNTTLASGEMAITGGSGSITKNGIEVPVERAAAITGNPAGHYFNFHTTLNPGGAIRGQLGTDGGGSVDPGVPVPY